MQLLRVGYGSIKADNGTTTGALASLNGFAAGFGFKLRDYSLDYAFSPEGNGQRAEIQPRSPVLLAGDRGAASVTKEARFDLPRMLRQPRRSSTHVFDTEHCSTAPLPLESRSGGAMLALFAFARCWRQ